MNVLTVPRRKAQPALRRLHALAPLDPESVLAVEEALRGAVAVPHRRDLVAEGTSAGEPRIIAEAWAARVRIQIDGRRQFLSFLLPGDLIGLCAQPGPLATTTVTALTPLRVALAPVADDLPALRTAYAMSKALEEAYLLDHIARLGRLNAQERILHLLLELDERLSLAGLAERGSFEMPPTQEQLADALGLTSVHVNRMLQQARREAGLVWSGRRVKIADPLSLGARIGRVPVRVSEAY